MGCWGHPCSNKRQVEVSLRGRTEENERAGMCGERAGKEKSAQRGTYRIERWKEDDKIRKEKVAKCNSEEGYVLLLITVCVD